MEVPAPFREARAPLVLDATLLCLAMPVLAMPAANEVILFCASYFLCLFWFLSFFLFQLAFFDLRKNGDVSARFTHSSIGEGPEYRPFRDLRSVPEAGRPREPVKNHGRGCTQVLFLHKAELGFFHFLEIVTGWLVPSAGKGAENTKEKSRQCFTCR